MNRHVPYVLYHICHKKSNLASIFARQGGFWFKHRAGHTRRVWCKRNFVVETVRVGAFGTLNPALFDGLLAFSTTRLHFPPSLPARAVDCSSVRRACSEHHDPLHDTPSFVVLPPLSRINSSVSRIRFISAIESSCLTYSPSEASSIVRQQSIPREWSSKSYLFTSHLLAREGGYINASFNSVELFRLSLSIIVVISCTIYQPFSYISRNETLKHIHFSQYLSSIGHKFICSIL